MGNSVLLETWRSDVVEGRVLKGGRAGSATGAAGGCSSKDICEASMVGDCKGESAGGEPMGPVMRGGSRGVVAIDRSRARFEWSSSVRSAVDCLLTSSMLPN